MERDNTHLNTQRLLEAQDVIFEPMYELVLR